MVEFRWLEFSLKLVVCGYASMAEVAARRGSDGWRPTFDSGYVEARDQGLEKQRTRDLFQCFQHRSRRKVYVARPSYSRSHPISTSVCLKVCFFIIYLVYISLTRGLSVASSCTFLLTCYDFSHTFREANALSAHSTRQHPPDSTAVSSQGRKNGYAESHDHG